MIMKKYKVTLYLMIDPTVNDNTFKKSYVVEAESESSAYDEAGRMQDNDEPNIRNRSIFNYKVELI